MRLDARNGSGLTGSAQIKVESNRTIPQLQGSQEDISWHDPRATPTAVETIRFDWRVWKYNHENYLDIAHIPSKNVLL